MESFSASVGGDLINLLGIFQSNRSYVHKLSYNLRAECIFLMRMRVRIARSHFISIGIIPVHGILFSRAKTLAAQGPSQKKTLGGWGAATSSCSWTNMKEKLPIDSWPGSNHNFLQQIRSWPRLWDSYRCLSCCLLLCYDWDDALLNVSFYCFCVGGCC